MVQDQGYKSYSSYVPDPQDSKSTYKIMVSDRRNMESNQQRDQNKGGARSKKSKTDVWGPIYQDKQHFINMHIC